MSGLALSLIHLWTIFYEPLLISQCTDYEISYDDDIGIHNLDRKDPEEKKSTFLTKYSKKDLGQKFLKQMIWNKKKMKLMAVPTIYEP